MGAAFEEWPFGDSDELGVFLLLL
ncbi:hypothetical protein MED222_19859 [Vibrio sp. MED222]|nr:hypothetical protein MED222_19859 [Vibrio sp. MED222]